MSDERQLNSGSGQQLVTGVKDNKTANGLWLVREAHGESTCESGTPVRCGDVVRLTHVTLSIVEGFCLGIVVVIPWLYEEKGTA